MLAKVVLTNANQVRFLDTGSNVITDKEQKRVWFSRLWLSIRRKQSKRKTPADTGGLAPPVTPSALADIQCECNDFYTTTITVQSKNSRLLRQILCFQ